MIPENSLGSTALMGLLYSATQSLHGSKGMGTQNIQEI